MSAQSELLTGEGGREENRAIISKRRGGIKKKDCSAGFEAVPFFFYLFLFLSASKTEKEREYPAN